MAIDSAKTLYLKNLGNQLNDATTTPKNYWKIIHRVMNKSRAPKIPPILCNGKFILSCAEKASLFNDFFSNQCKLIVNTSVLPDFVYLTDKRINNIAITDIDILSIIRSLNPNKAAGSDGISGQMLLLCDKSVVLPLEIIFRNILETSTYPNMWKLANVTPIFKKGR